MSNGQLHPNCQFFDSQTWEGFDANSRGEIRQFYQESGDEGGPKEESDDDDDDVAARWSNLVVELKDTIGSPSDEDECRETSEDESLDSDTYLDDSDGANWSQLELTGANWSHEVVRFAKRDQTVERHEPRTFPTASVNERRSAYGTAVQLGIEREKGESAVNPKDFILTALYNDQLIALKERPNLKRLVSGVTKAELGLLKSVKCDNIARFVGIVIDSEPNYILMEYCPRGSLYELLQFGSPRLVKDFEFKLSLCQDISRGLEYIHKSLGIPHGKLRSTNCLVDKFFRVKLSAFLPRRLLSTWFDPHDKRFPLASEESKGGSRSCMTLHHEQWTHFNENLCFQLLWTAPELLRELRQSLQHVYGTHDGDIYSFGIISHEILLQTGPFNIRDGDALDTVSIVKKVMNSDHRIEEEWRPQLYEMSSEVFKEKWIMELMTSCWSENPKNRPTARIVRSTITRILGTDDPREAARFKIQKDNEVLEATVAARTEIYFQQKNKVENIIRQLYPKTMADRRLNGESVPPQYFDSVTTCQADVVNFTPLAGTMPPEKLVEILNLFFEALDNLASTSRVTKYETIGDAYIVICGAPDADEHHAQEVSQFALRMRDVISSLEIDPECPSTRLRIRIGIHTGPAVICLLGARSNKFAVLGESVSGAMRMESHGAPMQIHVSQQTRDLLVDDSRFSLKSRGHIDALGEGEGVVETYFLEKGTRWDDGARKAENTEAPSVNEMRT